MSTDLLLDASGLRKVYGGVTAVSGLDLQVRANEVVGIIGPNGSGKTTLFNILSGFIKPNSGAVTWLGHDISRAPAHRRSQLGLVRTFQQAMTFDDLTVRGNVEMAVLVGLHSSGPDLEVDDLLRYVALEHVADNLAGSLSWGQSRLLGIALAMAVKPRLLMLDEPFAGLSLVAAEDLAKIVRRLAADGYALCIIDHEMGHLLPLCTRLVVLVNGAVLADGAPADVIEDPAVQAAYLGM